MAEFIQGSRDFNTAVYSKKKICDTCGKEFLCTPDWVYRDGSKFYCTYSCKYKKSRADVQPSNTTNHKKPLKR